MHIKHSKTYNENIISAIIFVICLEASINSFFILLKKHSAIFFKKKKTTTTPNHKVRVIGILCRCCYAFYINKALFQSLCCAVGQKPWRMTLAALIRHQPRTAILQVAVENGINVTDVSHSQRGRAREDDATKTPV